MFLSKEYFEGHLVAVRPGPEKYSLDRKILITVNDVNSTDTE